MFVKYIGQYASNGGLLIPLEAIEDVIDYEEIPEELAKTGEFFGLKIKGDSMEPFIFSYDELREKPVHIIGKVIELRGKLQKIPKLGR